jgi:hypothetical protein
MTSHDPDPKQLVRRASRARRWAGVVELRARTKDATPKDKEKPDKP